MIMVQHKRDPRSTWPWQRHLASVVMVLVIGLHESEAKIPTASLIYPGDIYIGVFVDLHRSSTSNRSECGELNTAAVQQMWSAIWAVDTLNNQTEPGMPKLGLRVFDTCDNALIALHHTVNFLRDTVGDFPSSCESSAPTSFATTLGVIGIGEAATLKPILGLLQVYSVPVVLATPSAASGLPAQSNMLTTAPTMASLVQALISVLTELKLKSIYAFSTSPAAMQDLVTAIVNRDITLEQSVTLTPDGITSDTVRDVLKMGGNRRQQQQQQQVFVLMLEPSEIDRVVDNLIDKFPDDDSIWLVATPSLDKRKVASWGRVLKHGFVVTPHPIMLQEFRSSFLGALSGRAKGRPAAINKYLQHVYGCKPDVAIDVNNNHSAAVGYVDNDDDDDDDGRPSCSALSYADLQQGFVQDSSVPFVSKAVSALAASLRIVQIGRCPELGTRCVGDTANRHGSPIFEDIMEALLKLSFSIQGNEPMEVEGTRFKFTEDGKLLFKHFDVYALNGSSLPIQVGWYSDNMGLNLNDITRRQRSGSDGPDATDSSKGGSDASIVTGQTTTLVDALHFSDDADGDDSSSVTSHRRGALGNSGSSSSAWVTAVIVAATVGIFVTFYAFVYVLVKIWDRTLAGNQFLSIVLQFGVISLYVTCFIYVMPPSEAVCNWRLFMHSVSYAVCYGVLLVKVMQLRSQVTIGLGGRISHLNQAILLAFIVGLQAALDVQWSVLRRPVFGFSDVLGDFHCLVSRTDFVCLQSYVLLLLLLVCGYSTYTRHIQRNHNEGRWILLASFCSVPVWMAWIITYLSMDDDGEDRQGGSVTHAAVAAAAGDLVICAGLLLAATVLVVTVFVPKLRTLSAQTRSASASSNSSSHVCDMSSTNSTTTVFSFDGSGMTAGTGGGTKKTKSFPSSLFAESLLRNPLYDFRSDKRLHHANTKKLHSIAETIGPVK